MRTTINPTAKSLVLFLAAVTLFAGCAPPATRALRSGQKLLERGQYSEAVAKFKSATLLLGNTNAQAFNYLGLACHLAGQPADAVAAYRRALSLNADLSEARYNLGCLFLDQGKTDQAKAELTAFTLRRANVADGWEKLGMAHLRAAESGGIRSRPGELSAAEKAFNESVRLDPGKPDGLVGLGLTRLQRGRATEATQCFKSVLTNQPACGPALLNLAIVCQQYLGERQAALEYYRKYLSIKPVPEDFTAVQTVVHRLELETAPLPIPPTPTPKTPINRPRAATASAEAGTNSQTPTPALAARSPTPIFNTASNNSAPDKSGSARELKAVSTPPPSVVQVETVPQEPILKLANDSLDTSAHMADASPVQPTDADAKSGHHSLLQRLNPKSLLASRQTGSTRQAQDSSLPQPQTLSAVSSESVARKFPRYHYQMPARSAPGNRAEAEPFFTRAVRAQQSQRLPEAIAAYRQALQRDPGFYDACYNLALASAQVGDLPLSLGTYENALALRPDSADARYNFALALKQGGCVVDAANELERILASVPNDGRSHLALANLYAQQLEQPLKARQHYLKVLETDPTNPQAPAIRHWLADTAR